MLVGMSKLACARWLRPLLLCAFVGACAEPAGATRIVGPDGTQMLHVHCADEQVACFQLAGELCPHGYFLSPIFDPHDGNFLVRCRAWTDEPAIAVNPAPPVPASPPTAASVPSPRLAPPPGEPDQSWPPAEVAKPAEPWPAPTAGGPAPSGAIRDVDTGY